MKPLAILFPLFALLLARQAAGHPESLRLPEPVVDADYQAPERQPQHRVCDLPPPETRDERRPGPRFR